MIKKDLDLGPAGQSLSQNIVFEKGNIHDLAAHLYSLRTGLEASDNDDETSIMREMIGKYSHFTKHFPTTSKQSKGEIFIVTGATGNLGAFIVEDLLSRPSISEVWALVRAPGHAAAGARVMKSLESRNIKLSEEQSSKLYAISSDLSQTNLGLDTHSLQRLLSSVTCIIHSAWAVNFNLGVHSFEDQHIAGTYNLLNFCLRSRLPQPAKFFFCSSVSTASGTPKPATIPETVIEDLSHAQNTGYGRSKLVTEHIVRNAMRTTNIHARVLRIGQLSGDTRSAIWNDTEAVALMIRSALSVKALPSLDEQPSWLPVDVCSRAVADASMTPEPKHDADLVYHLVNPRTFDWQKDLLPCLDKHPTLPPFEVVSPSEWLQRLVESEQDPAKNPSIKLLDFWRKKYRLSETPEETDDAPRSLHFDTLHTVKDIPCLGMTNDPVTDGLLSKYVDVWLGKWLAA